MASEEPSILAKLLGSMLRTAREVCEFSYDEAAVRAGCEVDWLIRMETGFALVGPEQVERLLERYGVRSAKTAEVMIDLARRLAEPPPWLARHLGRLRPRNRDVLLVEAESTLIQTYGVMLIPDLAQCEEYFRWVFPELEPDRDVDEGWHLLSSRQNHRPTGGTRRLEVIIHERALTDFGRGTDAMSAQVRHLLELSEAEDASVRLVPQDVPFCEDMAYPFDVCTFAGTDRLSVSHLPVLGMEIAPADLSDIWTWIAGRAATPEESRTILQPMLH
ncbi:helix-turn-helix domain-containing protein [Actinomadura rupiterrae]|uniref:helix-turn-helix domain-containing protein n=1 Tax=Actinomadura rupiterrae TaxID=559627 RepID=UPI0020A51B9C|nr:helix-turn-helix transcriptional regulator [Actinomadura rupiterrae]